MNSVLAISEENWKEISAVLTEKKLKKGAFLHREGDQCDFIAFIAKGALRAYYTDHKSVETNLLLNSASEFITDYESFLTHQPGNLSIQAIEDANVMLLNRKPLEQLYDNSFYWNKFGRLMAERIYLKSKKRAVELLLLSPEQRYLMLLEEHPDFFQRYALRDIASYLGITSQSLSRIRARLTKS
ncbi:MAG: Crp/Fnr family transcriptional regulator [Bacteroidota bacterium]